MKKLLFFSLFLSIFNKNVYSADLTGVRPLGMGGAYVALDDDPNALFWNPAGIKHIKEDMIDINYNIADIDNAHPRGNFIIINAKEKPMLSGGIGVSRHVAVINNTDFEKRDYAIAIADEYTKNLYIGISGKYIDERIDRRIAKTAFTMDAGVMMIFSDRFKIGVVSYNITDPSADSYKRKVQAGVNIKFFDFLNVMADGARLFSDNREVKYNYNIGGELYLGKSIMLRGGYSEEKIYDNRYAAGGIGVIFSDFTLNYAYVHDLTSGLKEKHLIGASYKF